MKPTARWRVFRAILILSVMIGLFLLGVSLLPFERAARLVNSLAADGDFASFTEERYPVLQSGAALVGVLLTLFATVMLWRGNAAQQQLEKAVLGIQGFRQAFWSDAVSLRSQLGSREWNRIDLVVLLGLMLVALITRLASLYIPLTHDEAYTYNTFASGSLWQTVSNYPIANNHVLLSILINIATDFLGNQLWSIRLPTLIAGVLMAPAAYWLGTRLYSKETGLLSAALVAVSPVLIHYSVLARGYVIISLLTLVTLALADAVRENKNRVLWAGLVIFSALGFYTVPVMLFPVGALYLWLFVSCLLGDTHGYKSRFDFIQYCLVSGVATILLTAILYTPILINDLDAIVANRMMAPLTWAEFPITIWVRTKNTWTDWTTSIPPWGVFLGVLGLVLGLLLHRKLSKHTFPLHLAFLLWVGFLLIARRPNMVPRMWLFLAAPFLIWAAGGLVEPLKLLSRKNSLAFHRIFVGAALTGAFLIGIGSFAAIPQRWQQKSSVESAAIYLKHHLREEDLVTASTKYLPQLKYYFSIYSIPQGYLRRSGSFPRAFLIVGQQERSTLETVAPKDGFNQSIVNLNTIKPVLQLEDLVVYEGYPVP